MPPFHKIIELIELCDWSSRSQIHSLFRFGYMATSTNGPFNRVLNKGVNFLHLQWKGISIQKGEDVKR